MNRRYLLTSLLALFFGAALLLNSCEDPIPDCERYSYGDITIRNQTGFSLYFALDDYNDFLLYNGSSKTYYDEPSGTHYFYVYDGYEWWYDTEYLSACEDLTFTWYLNKKKSTESKFYAEISRNGEIVSTLSEFKPVQK